MLKPPSQTSAYDPARRFEDNVLPPHATDVITKGWPRGPPLDPLVSGNKVRSIREAAELANVSVATLRRRIADGTGPRVVRMSTRRVGVRDSDFAAWLDQCSGD